MSTTTRQLRGAATAIAVALLLAGCSSGQPTAADLGTDTAPSTAVDKAALDAGTFPTMAQPEFGNATPLDIAVIEAQRMAEFTVLPFELDAELVQPVVPTQPLESGSALLPVFGKWAGDIAEANMIAGFVTSATNVSKDDQKSVTHAVLRFVDSATAGDAAERIHRIVSSTHSGSSLAVKIDSLPNTLAWSRGAEVRKSNKPHTVTGALTVRGDYIIYSKAQALAEEKDWTADMIVKALQLQEPMIDMFPATPLDSERRAPLDFKIDQDGVLKYTVPTPAVESRGTDDLAVYGPRGMAHTSSDPAHDYDLLKETGTDKVAEDFTNVYRTKSPEDAQKLMDGFVESSLAHGWIKAESPVGLADAPCMIKETSHGDHHACFVVNGRYMGEVSGLDNKEEVRQAISAQYLILEDAK